VRKRKVTHVVRIIHVHRGGRKKRKKGGSFVWFHLCVKDIDGDSALRKLGLDRGRLITSCPFQRRGGGQGKSDTSSLGERDHDLYF